jgi:hypothetical protein
LGETFLLACSAAYYSEDLKKNLTSILKQTYFEDEYQAIKLTLGTVCISFITLDFVVFLE